MDHNHILQISQDEADAILKSGISDASDLLRFPFGDLLYQLWTRDNGAFRAHGDRVLRSMNLLLDGKPEALITGPLSQAASFGFGRIQAEIAARFGDFNEQARFLFRIAALYHDIGKYIIRERHPTIGRYTMEFLEPRQRDLLRQMLGDREDFLQLLLVMVRDHDQFGVLGTGEASYPILIGAATSLGAAIDNQVRTVSSILWLNVADMAGVENLNMTSDDLERVISDWQWYIDALNTCYQKQERLADFIIRRASEEELVIRRISRLILEAARKAPARYGELREIDGSAGEMRVTELVRRQLRTVYPTHIPRREFTFEFTHICKLDYAKRFFEALVDFCEGPRIDDRKRPLNAWAAERVDTERFIYANLAILRRITSTYSAMIDSKRGPGNLIGVEMKDLTPDHATEKTSQICRLLLDSHYPGLSWIMSDCPAWYF